MCFESYQKGRDQNIMNNETNMELGTITCGVPQWITFDLLLFQCYVNDKLISFEIKLLVYANYSGL